LDMAANQTVLRATVIIPSYNHELYVAEAIDSVLGQDLAAQRFELIVIDDGSSDGSRHRIEETLSRHPGRNATFIEQANRGVAGTLNRGLELAAGDCVLFLASDDRLLPHALSTLLAALDRADSDGKVCAAYADGYLINAAGERQCLYSHKIPHALIAPIRDELLVRNFIPGMGTLYRKDAVVEVGSFDPDINIEDWDLLLRLARRYDFLRVHAQVFEYRIHEQNTSHDERAMIGMLEKFGNKHPEWARFYQFKQALRSWRLRGALESVSLKNCRLLTRLLVAQLRQTFSMMRRRT
jgi:glycosyltransferase involved in cell wall biosynthesis